jgi:rod shape-determining protein MreD
VIRFLTIMSSRWSRLVLVMLFVIALQTTLFSDLRPFGVAAQLVLLFVIASGVNHGVAVGAMTGLIAGLMYDFVLPTPVGLVSLVLGLAGATAGLLIYFFRQPTLWMKVVAIAVCSVLGEIYYPLAQAVVGIDGWLQLRLIKVVIVVAICNVIFSPIAILLSRWTLADRKLTV